MNTEATFKHFLTVAGDPASAAMLTLAAAMEGQQPAASKLLTPPQVARLYGVSPDTVREWIADGELQATNIAKKGKRPMHRVRPDALADFDSRRGKPAPSQARRRPKQGDLIVTRY